MKRILVFLWLIPCIAFANEFRLAGMGRAYFVFPNPETDSWINAAYLSDLQVNFVGFASAYQQNIFLTPVGVYPAITAQTYPDESSTFTQFRYHEVQGMFTRYGGIFHLRLSRSEVWAPRRIRSSGIIIAEDRIAPLPLYSSTNYRNPFWEIEFAYARKLSPDFQIGIRMIPFSRRILPDFYNLIPFSYTDTDLLSSAGYREIQMGVVGRFTHRLRLGISLSQEQYRWQIETRYSDTWQFSQLAFNAIADYQVSDHGTFRLWYRQKFPNLKAPILNTNYFSNTPDNFVTIRPQSAIHTLALSYALQRNRINLNIALVNDWGSLFQTKFYSYQKPLGNGMQKSTAVVEVVNSYLTAGVSLEIHPRINVQSGVVMGGKGYALPGIFETIHTTSISRAPTLGIAWTPSPHWEVNATMLPRSGMDIVNSTKNNENFYQVSLRYYWQ